MSWGAGLVAGASAGPPLVVLTMNSPSNCDVGLCNPRLWLTRRSHADKNAAQGRLSRGCGICAEARGRALLPLARREIDGGAVAGIATAHPAAEGPAAPAAHRPDQQHSADQVGEEPRQEQQQPRQHGEESAGVGLDAGDIGVGDGDAEAGNAAAPGPAQHQKAGQRGRQHEEERRRPVPTIAATRIKAPISASGSNRMAMMIHFTMAAFLAAVPAAGEVGAGAGIVYGRFEATRRPCRPKRLFMAAVAFLHYSVGTGIAPEQFWRAADWPRG